jgi:hypothetical protein
MAIERRRNENSRVRWFIPSIADLIFLAFLSVLVYTNLSVRLLGDAGIGWHIRTGQWILANHTVPHANLFSSSMTGQPWFAWEWLYDVAVGWLDSFKGLNAVVFFTAAVIAATFSSAFFLLQRRGSNLVVALVLVLLAASASMIHFFARPHVLSWLFTLIWFCILDSSEKDFSSRKKTLWLLPPLMLLWVNVHGGFLIGFVLLAIYWLSAIWEWWRIREDRFEDVLRKIRAGKRAILLVQIGILSGIATFGNPYGWKLHAHIYHYLSSRFLMDHIDEFKSPNFHGIAQKCFALLLLLTLVALIHHRWKMPEVPLSNFLIILFAVYSGLYAARNIPVASILLILIVAPWLSDAFQSASEKLARLNFTDSTPATSKSSFFQRMQMVDINLRGHLWPVVAVLLTGWIVANHGQLGSKRLIDAHFDPKRFPAAAVDYIQQHRVEGPLFAPDAWGGYLIYRLYPQDKVVIDDRHDFYGEEFLRPYLKTIHVEPDWQSFLLQHPANALVIPKPSALANILLETPHWRPIYSDEVVIVFVP